MPKVDLFVIGGGSGGVRAARKAAEQGKKVVLAEASRLGGTCVNMGCVPKKLLSYAAHFGHVLDYSKSYGWRMPDGKPSMDWDNLRDAVDDDIKRLNEIYGENLANADVEVVFSHATLQGPNKVVADETQYETEAILIATGGKPSVPPTEGFAQHACVSDDIFTLPQLPQRAIIAGAGYIAVEFACILSGLGVKTSLVHRGPTVLKNFDISIQRRLLAEMERSGVALYLDKPISKLAKTDDGLVAICTDGTELTADLFLSATGRKPNTANMGLEEAGVELAKNGAVTVNDSYQSNVPSIYAVGDAAGRVALTPVAIAEGMRFVALKYGGEGPPVDYGLIPTAVFTHPNCGTVGMTEQQARESYPDCETTEAEFTPMYHSLTGNTEKTMMKLIFEAGGGRVLGAHMVGPDSGEIMQGIAVALAKGATKKDFDATIGIHPTAAEEFVSMR